MIRNQTTINKKYIHVFRIPKNKTQTHPQSVLTCLYFKSLYQYFIIYMYIKYLRVLLNLGWGLDLCTFCRYVLFCVSPLCEIKCKWGVPGLGFWFCGNGVWCVTVQNKSVSIFRTFYNKCMTQLRQRGIFIVNIIDSNGGRYRRDT